MIYKSPEKNPTFTLETPHSTYCFRVMENGQLEHLYYGRRIHVNPEALRMHQAFAAGNSVVYRKDEPYLTPESYRYECSSLGKGDLREPFLDITFADGGRTADFVYDSATIQNGKPALSTLPSSYGEETVVSTLEIKLVDRNYGATLYLYYSTFSDCDVITRSARLENTTGEDLRIERLLSGQLDFDDDDFLFSSFHGAWAREMERTEQSVAGASLVNSSVSGWSSNRANPFTMLYRPTTSEDAGECYGMNLIYSGNHYTCCQDSAFRRVRVVTGINPQSFSYLLTPGECFEAPEAVYAYSYEGFGGMSRRMHHFVREHIVRGSWKNKPRPVLLNSWEANYFQITEKKLLSLAKKAADVGIELFVMDDGWFGERKDDAHSLGDWTVNQKKIPSGLAGLADKIHGMGLDFGIWVEPEMVNVDSDLYRAHPDWVIDLPEKDHSEERNQRILDLLQPEVRAYIVEAMCKIFSTPGINYVKWDMNRNFSDVFSRALPKERQGEVFHRYILGLYDILQELMEQFPDILFEGCASGGNRFDLGMLCYFPQIWASDNTDAFTRMRMMENYSYAYPMNVIGAHVSASPNHQTLRYTTLDTRFQVAAFGVLGYELNLSDISSEGIDAIKKQVALYKEKRDLFFHGEFYRGRSGNIHEWTVVSKDKSQAAGLLFQELCEANQGNQKYYAKGLEADTCYRFYNYEIKRNIKAFGDLVNIASPVHLKTDSLMMDLAARFVKLDGEIEEHTACGDLFMHAGVQLKNAYAGTGFDQNVRFFPDFGSRLYFMDSVPEKTARTITENAEKASDEI